MRAWTPKRKKSETEDLIAQADALQSRKREELKRVGIRNVRMLAAAPPVAALGLLILFPFLLSDGATPPPGVATPGPGPGTGPVPTHPTGPAEVGPDLPPPPGPTTTDPRPVPPPPTPGQEDLSPHIAALLDGSLRYQQRLGAADKLGLSRDPRALEALLQAALARDSNTRALAARALPVRLPDPRAETALRQLLEDPVPAVAESAAENLAKGSDARALLVGRLQRGDPPDQVHMNCIRGLNYQGEADDIPLLMRWVREGGPVGQAATEAVWAICRRTGAPTPPGLPKLLR